MCFKYEFPVLYFSLCRLFVRLLLDGKANLVFIIIILFIRYNTILTLLRRLLQHRYNTVKAAVNGPLPHRYNSLLQHR